MKEFKELIQKYKMERWNFLIIQNDDDEIVIRMSLKEMGNFFNQSVNERDKLSDLFHRLYGMNYVFCCFNQLNNED